MRALSQQRCRSAARQPTIKRRPLTAINFRTVQSADPFGAVTLQRGFFPLQDPLPRLPGSDFESWEQAASELPKLAAVAGKGQLRAALLDLPPFPLAQLGLDSSSPPPWPLAAAPSADADGLVGLEARPAGQGSPELWRSYQLLSFLAHAYCWCDGPDPPPALPAHLARPWVAVAAALDMPPVQTYCVNILFNWRRLTVAGKPLSTHTTPEKAHGSSTRKGRADTSSAIPQLGQAVSLNEFLGGPDEEWFRMVHLAIEATAAPAMAALAPLQAATAVGDWAAVETGLGEVVAALRRMRGLLALMPERCDPYIFYHRVRRPVAGWRGNDQLPQGLLYEGVWEAPLQLYGESGAQSSILPALDAALGVQHAEGWLRDYLATMRLHMPPAHRAFIAALQPGGPLLRAALSCAAPGTAAAQEGYNAVLAELEVFRGQHRAMARKFIAPGATSQGLPPMGTGGTEFLPALETYRATTGAHKLKL